MAPWWLRSGNDETWLEDEAPGVGDDAVSTTAVPLAAEDYAQTPGSDEPAFDDSMPDEESPDEESLDEESLDEESLDEESLDEAADEDSEIAAEAEAPAPAEGDPEEPASEEQPPKRRRRRRRRRRKPRKDAAVEVAPAPRAVPQAEMAPAEPEPAAPVEPILAPVADIEPGPALDILRSLVYPLPERSQSISDERKIAMFCDFENIALGVRDSRIKKLDVILIL